jgi:hypothetical protein
MIRSRTARSKIECSSTWYFLTLRAERPSATAPVTQSWIVEGRIRASRLSPNAGRKCLLR